MKNKITHIIIKALSGEISVEELNILEKWKKEKNKNSEEAQVMEDLWDTKFHYPGIVNSEEEFSNLWDKAHSKKSEGKIRHLVINWNAILKIASVFLVFLAVAFLLFKSEYDNPKNNIAIAKVAKSNPRGQKSRIYLEDGTWIWLNSSSKVEYLDSFKEQNERNLSLSGEAFFEVAKDSLRPFIIQSDPIIIKVLGTKFNVNTNDNGRISVALKEGSVKINWQDFKGNVQKKLLVPGEIIFIDKESRLSIDGKYDPKEVLAWKDGILYFKDSSLDQVKQKLQDWYDVDIIVVGSPNKPWNYNGIFDNYNLSNVLTAMSFAENFYFELEGDVVKINFN